MHDRFPFRKADRATYVSRISVNSSVQATVTPVHVADRLKSEDENGELSSPRSSRGRREAWDRVRSEIAVATTFLLPRILTEIGPLQAGVRSHPCRAEISRGRATSCGWLGKQVGEIERHGAAQRR